MTMLRNTNQMRRIQFQNGEDYVECPSEKKRPTVGEGRPEAIRRRVMRSIAWVKDMR